MKTALAYAVEGRSTSSAGWTREQTYFSGDEYFSALEHALAGAKQSIEVEAYIFEADTLGKRIARQLIAAARRNVQVRVLVDGIGSAGWVYHYGTAFTAARIQFKVYHQLPWERLFTRGVPGGGAGPLLSLFRRLNHRTHRKIFLIDGRQAWIGGMNIWDVHLHSVMGDGAWRDTSVCVEGPPVSDVVDSFQYHWLSGRKRMLWRMKRWHAGDKPFRSPWVLLNSPRGLRIRNYRQLIGRISNARERIWITCSYFVPPGMLLQALRDASSHGADVRILVPGRSDLFFMPWAMGAFFFGLLKAGVRIYRYRPAILHAKTMIVDDWAIIGSSNLNHRSWMHDLEVDVVLNSQEAKGTLHDQFLHDLGESDELSRDSYRIRPMWERYMSRLSLLFRHWM